MTEIHIPKPEVLEQHEDLERAVKTALVITVAAALYHHRTRDNKAYSYIRPTKEGFSWEIGLLDSVDDKYEIRQLFGSFTTPSGQLDQIDQADITVTDSTGPIEPEEIESAFGQDQ